jgi:hypothetical protein
MDSANVRQRINHGGLHIVRTYPSDDELKNYPRDKLNKNVKAYDAKGELAWTIQECPVGGADQDKAYMDIQIKDGQLIAGNWVGLDFVVNLTNGNVSPYKKGVRPW